MAAATDNLSRRNVLTATVRRHIAPLPPGVNAISLDRCTGCGACVTACPQGILDITDGKVAVNFDNGECTFCGACAAACSEPVFDGAEMAHLVAIGDDCLALRGVTCMSCRDACPEAAIGFLPRAGGPFLPEVAGESCTGCGACISRCPADAVHVRGREMAHA